MTSRRAPRPRPPPACSPLWNPDALLDARRPCVRQVPPPQPPRHPARPERPAADHLRHHRPAAARRPHHPGRHRRPAAHTLWAAVAALVFIRYRGRTLADWAPIAARYGLRRLRGQLIWLVRPSSRPVREGLLHLPGSAASLRVVTAPDRRYGAVHDPHAGTLTAIVKVSSRAYALLDPGTQSANVNGWGRALAALARTGQVARIQVVERTVPDTGDALRRYWEEHGRPDAPLAGELYGELIRGAGPAAAPHEAYVAVAMDFKAARRLINQAGGGLTGGFAVLAQLTSAFEQSARTAGLNPTGWLNAGEIAAVARTAYDPKSCAALDRWSEDGRPAADPAAAGRWSWWRRPTTSRPTPPTTPPTGWRTGPGRRSTPASCTSSCSPRGYAAPSRSATSRRTWTRRCAMSAARKPASSPTRPSAPARPGRQ